MAALLWVLFRFGMLYLRSALYPFSDLEVLEENQKGVKENPEYYRSGQQFAEHQFEPVKRQWGFTFVLMKGKRNVFSKVNLIIICYNITRLTALLDPNELKNWLKRPCLAIFGIFKGVYDILSHFLFPASLHDHKRTGHKTFA